MRKQPLRFGVIGCLIGGLRILANLFLVADYLVLNLGTVQPR